MSVRIDIQQQNMHKNCGFCLKKNKNELKTLTNKEVKFVIVTFVTISLIKYIFKR